MKSKIKRLLALVLCLTMILNGNVSLLASDETTAEDQVVTEAVEEIKEEVAEEATEETAEAVVEEVVEEETIEAVAEETEVQEVNNDEVVEKVADEEKDAEISLQTELNGTIITMSGPKSSFPAGTDYSVSASELSEKALSDVEASLRKVELETEEKIASYKAYDIKLIVDGKEVQPVGDVDVTFQGKEVKEQVAQADSVEVYHVDEAKQEAVEVKGDVKNNEVVMTTDHFSTYVITTTNNEGVTVTVQHYLTSGNTKLYRDSQETLKVTERLEDISVAANYKVDRVVEMSGETEVKEISGDTVITANTTYRVYYSPTPGEYEGALQVFDYQVRPTNNSEQSINIDANYPSGVTDSTKVSAGKVGQNANDTKYYVYKTVGTTKRNVNEYTNGNSVVPGIITGVDYRTGALIMGKNDDGVTMNEPGFFTTTTKPGKQVLTGYTARFTRNGDTYTLNSIYNGATKADDAGSGFFPLDGIRNNHPDQSNESNHNCFFGLRYDIEFKIGDYVGPLTYTFTGDDDLWVVLDAKDSETGGRVVVDLGGIHKANTGTVNLWDELELNPSTISETERNKTHTLTILYMERGAGESNCNMSFTLPNSKVINSSVNPTSFQFTKVTSKDQPLAGAQFGLYDGTTLNDTVTSDTNGVVKFENLYPGTYTVKETKAPSGYVKDTTEYTLTVTKNNNNYVTSMTVGDDSEGVTKVTNYTQQEEAEKNVTVNKKATVVDENNRKFKINLTAATRGETEGTNATAASIVLVLDASSSMSGSFESLQQAVAGTEGFINKIASVSPSSKIGIVFYYGTETDNNTHVRKQDFLTLNESNVNSLKRFVNNQGVSGGTPMGDGLEAAYNMLNGDSSGNQKYVIFFTDGRPGYSSTDSSTSDATSFNCRVANNAEYYAELIKSTGTGGQSAILYTVGYNLGNSTFYWNDTHGRTGSNCGNKNGHSSMTAANFLSTKIATSSEHAFLATNINDLKVRFDDLAGELGSLFEVQAEKIVDVIDSRFELTAESKKILEDTYKDNVKITPNADGTTTIEWLNKAAIIANDKDGGWKQEIVVQAKPEFVGGNMIPTNGPESGVYLEDSTIKFPQPSVNVKLLEPSLERKKITVYKGDVIDSTTFAKVLADSLKVTKLYTNAEEKISVVQTLTTDQLATLNSKKAVEVNYSYQSTTDIIGKFKFELTTNPSTLTPETNHVEAKSGTDVEVYTLKVTYIPDTVNERKSELSGIDQPTANGGTEVTTKTATADYVVNVISGEIRITKTLKETSDVARDFTFLVQEGINDPIEVTITVPAGETSASYTGDALKDLPRGTYTITEKDVDGYVLDGVEIISNLTNCQNSKVEAESVTFILGNDASGANVIKSFAYNSADGGTLGAANFTNEKVYKDWSIVKRSSTNNSLCLAGAEFELRLKDGAADSVWYKGVSQENGSLKWYKNGTTELGTNEYILRGVYTLKETKAPVGYAVSDATWTVTVAARGYLKNIVASDKGGSDTVIKDGKFTCYIDNTPLYELPHSGGLGIYTYTIGGILLMAFATLILYKNRRKEVLARY